MRRLPLLTVVILLFAAQRASAANPGIDSVSPAVFASSPSPQMVTITGHDFAPGATVALIYAPPSPFAFGQGRGVEFFTGAPITHDVTVVSSSKITMTVQYQPTATLNLIVSVSNAPDSAPARGAMTITAAFSDATPVIFDVVFDPDFFETTTTVQARVTPHSTAYLVYGGQSPGSYISGVNSVSDDDGDGIVGFPSFNRDPGFAVFFVIDSTGVRHWAGAPWSTPLPEKTLQDVSVELGTDGLMSRLVENGITPFPLYLWVRPGVGGWWVETADGGSGDSDVPSITNSHVNVLTATFRPLGTSPSPPVSFQSSDVLVLVDWYQNSWWSSVLSAPLTGTPGDGTIYATALNSREGTPGILYLGRRGGAEGPISIDYRTSNGTAMSDVNYVPSSGTVTFARGEFLKTVSIDTRRDGTYAADLSYNVELTPHGTSVDTGNTVKVFVGNVDAPPAISIGDVRIAEGDSGARTVNVPVTLVGSTTLAASVFWYASDGTQGGLQFAPGETSKSIAVTYAANTDPGPDRMITITLALQFSTPATIAKATGAVTIVDDDTQTLSVSDVRAEEQSQTANFLVTMSRAVNAPVTVHYATADGTATAPLDYAATSGIVTFAPGEIAKTVTVAIVPDRLVDPDETFTLRLSDATGASISKSSGTATIVEDDRLPEPVVLIDDVAVAEGNAGTTDATFNVRLSFASSLPVVVAWKTENGSARDDSDYVAGSGTLTFAPGETVLPVIVKIAGDTTPEPNENFRLVIIGASNAILGTGSTCTIINDDGQPPAPRHRAVH